MNKKEIKGPHATKAHKAQIILSSHHTGLRLQKSLNELTCQSWIKWKESCLEASRGIEKKKKKDKGSSSKLVAGKKQRETKIKERNSKAAGPQPASPANKASKPSTPAGPARQRAQQGLSYPRCTGLLPSFWALSWAYFLFSLWTAAAENKKNSQQKTPFFFIVLRFFL